MKKTINMTLTGLFIFTASSASGMVRDLVHVKINCIHWDHQHQFLKDNKHTFGGRKSYPHKNFQTLNSYTQRHRCQFESIVLAVSIQNTERLSSSLCREIFLPLTFYSPGSYLSYYHNLIMPWHISHCQNHKSVHLKMAWLRMVHDLVHMKETPSIGTINISS